MVKLDHIKHTIEPADGVGCAISDGMLTLSKDGKSISREFIHSRVSVSITDGNVVVFCHAERKRH